jgi:hypothetical protein
MSWKWIFLGPLAVVGGVLFIALGGVIVQFLWNWLLPPLFGWPLLTFWQALALLALCRILFGGFGGGSSHRATRRRHIRSRIADRMADRIAARWQHMTPEERERFRQRLRDRCGFDPAASESRAQ